MIADENIYMEAASQTMYEMSADELVKRQCRARRDYYKQMNSHNRTIRELEEAKRALEDKDIELNNAHMEIEQLKKQIATLKSQQK